MQLVVSGMLNYELNSQHDITVLVSDSNGKTYLANFTVTVQDVNDPPTVPKQNVCCVVFVCCVVCIECGISRWSGDSY